MFLAGGVPTSKPKASAKREPRKVPPARGRWGLQHLVPGRGARHGSLGKPDLDEFGHFTAVDVQPHVPAALRRAESVLSRVEVPARVGLEFTGTGHTSGYSSSTLVPRGLAGSGQRGGTRLAPAHRVLETAPALWSCSGPGVLAR